MTSSERTPIAVTGPRHPESTATIPRRRWQYVTALAALPWIFVLIDSSWLYSPPGTIDPWLYHGFMRDYPEFVSTLFPSTYYGTRLGWIVPGFIAYETLPPLIANAVLHLGLYYAAVGATYVLLAQISNASTAFLGAVMVGTSPSVLFALGWNYVDGAVITYALVAVALAAKAASARLPAKWLALSGAALACMVHSNLVAVLLLPTAPIVFVSLSPGARAFRLQLWGAYAAGAIAVTFVLGTVNAAAGGSWMFFMPSIRWALAAGPSTHPSNPFYYPAITLLLTPAIALVALGAMAVRRDLGGSRLALGATLIWMVASFSVFDLTGGSLLATQYYAVWLVPFAILFICTLWADWVTRATPPAVWAVAAFLVASGIVGIRPEPGPISADQERLLSPWMWYTMSAALVAVTLVMARQAVAITMLIWIVLYGAVSATAGHAMSIRPDPASKDLFMAVERVLTIVSPGDPPRRVLFWYGRSPLARHFNSIASTHLFQYSLVGDNFPVLPSDATDATRFSSRVQAGSRVAVLTSEAVDMVRVRAEFQAHGLQPRVAGVHTITAGRLTFLLTLLEIGSNR